MKGHEVPAAVASSKTSGQRTNDVALKRVLDWTVAPENPYESGVSIPPSEPLAVLFSVLDREDLRPLPPLLVPFVAPRRKKPDVEAERIGLGHDPVHVREVRFVRL